MATSWDRVSHAWGEVELRWTELRAEGSAGLTQWGLEPGIAGPVQRSYVTSGAPRWSRGSRG